MTRMRAHCLLFAAFALSASRADAAPLPGTLVKASLPIATAEAKHWRPDAVLTQVNGRDIGNDGSGFWTYVYYARSAPAEKSCLLVDVIGGRAGVTETAGCDETAIPGFIDSAEVMRIARASGITKASVTLGLMSSVTAPGGAVWIAMDGAGTAAGDVVLDIDAVNGSVLARITQQTARGR